MYYVETFETKRRVARCDRGSLLLTEVSGVIWHVECCCVDAGVVVGLSVVCIYFFYK